MAIIEKIKSDSLEARKNKDALSSNLLVTLYSEIVKVGKDSGNRETTDDESIVVIKKFVKNLEETKEILTNKESPEYLKIVKELEILNQYLPIQLSDKEISNIIDKLPNKNIGEVMKYFKNNHFGKYDAKIVTNLLKKG